MLENFGIYIIMQVHSLTHIYVYIDTHTIESLYNKIFTYVRIYNLFKYTIFLF